MTKYIPIQAYDNLSWNIYATFWGLKRLENIYNSFSFKIFIFKMSNFLIPKYLQPDGEHLDILRLFDLTDFIRYTTSIWERVGSAPKIFVKHL